MSLGAFERVEDCTPLDFLKDLVERAFPDIDEIGIGGVLAGGHFGFLAAWLAVRCFGQECENARSVGVRRA